MHQNKLLKKRWIKLQPINEGGQGVVIKVKDKLSDKIYAAKIFKPKKFQVEKLKRIKSEIEILKKLKGDTNIVTIYDDNLEESIKNSSTEIFYIMDFSKYGSLKNNDFFINDVELSLLIFREIIEGISNAHKAKVIHRDLKPENILFYPTQRKVVITDFGLGLLKERNFEEQITREDEILGPMHFISPEQYKNPSQVDERSDIYSLGKILFYLLTGRGKVFREELGDLSSNFQGLNPYLPLIQTNLLNRMVVEKIDRRFSNVGEIKDEVDQIIEQINQNSKRILRKKDKYEHIYSLIISPDREKFVKYFTKDLSFNLKILEWALIELNDIDKKTTASNLLTDLYSTYTKGKTNCAVKCVDAYINNPKKLQEYEKKHKAVSFPSFFLAKYFFNAKSYNQSHLYIEKALLIEDDPEIKLVYLLFFADVCKDCKCDRKHDFDKRITELVHSTEKEVRKISLYRILGNHYLETGEKEKGLMYMEAFLNTEPFDNDIRFKCGYEYSNIKDEQIALFHYLIHIKNNKDSSTTLNNLGVIYGNNNMPIKAMEMYQQSYKQNNTLAGSNIASLYLQIGQKDESLKLLRQIIHDHHQSDYDQRVDIVLGSIPENQKQEEINLKDFNDQGAILNHHHIEYIKQLSIKDKYNWIGDWEINSRYVVKIVSNNNKLTFESTVEPKITIAGIFEGNCYEIEKYGISYSENYNKGYLYLINNDEFRGYARKQKDKPYQIIGKRIQNLKEYYEKHPSFVTLAAALATRITSNQ